MRKIILFLFLVLPMTVFAQKDSEADKWAKEKAAKEAAYSQAVESAKTDLESGKPFLKVGAAGNFKSVGCELQPITEDGQVALLHISGTCILTVAEFEQVKKWFDANFK